MHLCAAPVSLRCGAIFYKILDNIILWMYNKSRKSTDKTAAPKLDYLKITVDLEGGAVIFMPTFSCCCRKGQQMIE